MRDSSRMLAAASAVALCAGMLVRQAAADDQTKPGVGNAAAITLAKKSPMVSSAYQFLLEQAERIRDNKLRHETLDALGNPTTCIRHRENYPNRKKTLSSRPSSARAL